MSKVLLVHSEVVCHKHHISPERCMSFPSRVRTTTSAYNKPANRMETSDKCIG